MLIVVAATLVASITDARTFRVHNIITIPLLLTGLIYHTVVDGMAGFSFSVAGAVVGFCFLIIPYAMGAMGAGDVKLLAALGAWLGVGTTGAIALVACVATGVYSLICLMLRGGWREAWLNIQVSAFRVRALGRHLASDQVTESIQEMRQHPEYRKRLIPFSVMLGIGVVVIIAIQLSATQ